MRIFANEKISHNKTYKYMYIEKIKSPADLKGLDIEALNIVADETRRAVLNRVSKHGGHRSQLGICRSYSSPALRI